MPLIKIEILEGKDSAYKKTFVNSVNKAASETLGVSYSDCTVRLYEMQKEFLNAAPDCTGAFSIVEIICFPRSAQVKKDAILAISGALRENLGIGPKDLYITFNEPGLESWGVNGKPACETA